MCVRALTSLLHLIDYIDLHFHDPIMYLTQTLIGKLVCHLSAERREYLYLTSIFLKLIS